MNTKTLFGMACAFLLLAFNADKGEVDHSTSMKNWYKNQLDTTIKALDRLETSSCDSLTITFHTFRRSVKKLAFILPLTDLTLETNFISGSKHQVLSDQTIPSIEKGALQRIEYIILSTGALDKADQDLKFIKSLLLQLQSDASNIRFREDQLLSAIFTDYYQQYFLSLTGYELIELESVPKDFEELLLHYIYLLELITIDHPENAVKLKPAVALLKQSYQYIKDKSFEDLDRLVFLKDYLIPFQELLLNSIEQPEVGPLSYRTANPFSKLWFDVNYFSQLSSVYQSKEAIALGKLLFYEPMLSKNNKRTCASCHKAQKAFSDGRRTSLGFDFSANLDHNAPALLNTVYNRKYGHDLRFSTLDEQIESVIYNHQEFRSSFAEIEAKLATSEGYQQLFQEVYGPNAKIDATKITGALKAYLSTVTSFNSPFDQYMRGELSNIDPLAAKGYNLFMGKAQCGTCHFAPLFSGVKPMVYSEQEGHIQHQFSFHQLTDSTGRKPYKTPTVRNLDYSIPYTHNGSVFELEPFLTWKESSNELNALLPIYNSISPEEKHALKTFLVSLNDSTKFIPPADLPDTDGTLAPVSRRPAGIY